MKIFVYKTLFIFVCIFILFQLTIGAKINQLDKELTELKSMLDNILYLLHLSIDLIFHLVHLYNDSMLKMELK